jgi:hypothetical protein
MPIPSMNTTNKIEAASITLPRIGDRIPGLLLRDGFVGQENGFVRSSSYSSAHTATLC